MHCTPSNRAVVAGMAPVLDAIRVDARRRVLSRAGHRVAIAAVIVDVFEVESVYVTGEVPAYHNSSVCRTIDMVLNAPKDRKQHVDPKVDATAGNEEDAERRDWSIVSQAVRCRVTPRFQAAGRFAGLGQ